MTNYPPVRPESQAPSGNAATTSRWPFCFSARTDGIEALIARCRSGFFRRLVNLDPWGTK